MNHLIFPHQLYYNLNKIYGDKIKKSHIYLIEEPRYFTEFGFHKLKLAFHRASMKKYYDKLKSLKYNISYIDFYKVTNKFYKDLKGDISYIHIGDFALENKLKKLFSNSNITILENINFLVKTTEFETIKSVIKNTNSYSHEKFYQYQRKKLKILIDSNNKPIGGKWSYDKLNRLKLPPNHKCPKLYSKIIMNSYKLEAINYVNKHFNSNYGDLTHFIYPIDNKDSKKWLNKFLKERLQYFGIYEDAIDSTQDFLYHSVLSPMMNIGIITDEEVVSTSYKYYNKYNKSRKIPISSFEGFIRQIIGWRNYVYLIYHLENHDNSLYESNLLKHHGKIDERFWTASTNILPIDNCIKKIQSYAYVHHIERLMILGNFLLLLFIDPKEVYRIFMEWTIDAYDWVMVPNVFSMSQFATNRLMMTRPYFSSSNYILKMSAYKRDEWCSLWDALYYNFISKHHELLRKIYATAILVKYYDIKSKKEKDELIRTATKYIKN
jgi:deoxyribodipyrimidine photolyase-related protein